LLPALQAKLNGSQTDSKRFDPFGAETTDEANGDEETAVTRPATVLTGWESVSRVVLVDQSILGKTPRSNPAVYIGAFDQIREFFAQSEAARQAGLGPSAFSFNSSQGQCERCRGAGFEKIEMQFLSDVFIRCPECAGKRYRPHILEVKVKVPRVEEKGKGHSGGPNSFSIADLLDATIEETLALLGAFSDSRSAGRAVQSLQLLAEVGLGYLKLGQPINTLSGGESQRLKLVRYLAESELADHGRRAAGGPVMTQPSTRGVGQGSVNYSLRSTHEAPLSTLFLFDEPTTGLHFDDVKVLLKIFQRLVDSGHSVIVIEHNLDVIKSADWVIDLGPEAGDDGGELVVAGTPEDVADCERSHTGRALGAVLRQGRASVKVRAEG
jgi:excinuclease ABC subunit A